MLTGRRNFFRLLEAAAIVVVSAPWAGAQDLGKTRLDDGKPSYQAPALRFEGFDTEAAYPKLPCEVHLRLFGGKWPYTIELRRETGGVKVDAERALVAWAPQEEGEVATFTVRVSDAAGAAEERSGRVECRRAGFRFVRAQGGSDDNPGTEDRPWKTIGRASTELKPGETVFVRAGAYDESRGPEGEQMYYRPALTPARSGEPGRPGTSSSSSGTTRSGRSSPSGPASSFVTSAAGMTP